MDVFSKLKKAVKEPRIYALIVESEHGQTLHLGVYFSLEEAYAAARARMESLMPHRPGEAINIDLWNTLSARQVIAQMMDPSWANELINVRGKKDAPLGESDRIATVISGGNLPDEIASLLASFSSAPAGTEGDPLSKKTTKNTVPTTINDHVKDIKNKKNLLMKKLIDEGSVSQAEKLRHFLGTNSTKYVLNAIEKKNNKI